MKRSDWLGIAIAAVGIVVMDVPTSAQVVPDETLGSERSRINPFNSQIDLIEGGAVRGINQFHSFRDFNVESGRGIYFIALTANIQNILARVTGTNPSQILGLLGTASRSSSGFITSNANLFLINPNGILFGENAALDVDRSFFATTANGIQFGNRGLFSASRPERVSDVLTINPSAFLFSQIPTSKITVNTNMPSRTGSSTLALRVPDGQTLSLLGGNIEINGGQLNALGGRVEIGAIAGEGTIRLNPNGSLQFPEETLRSDITIKNSSPPH